MKSDKIDKSHWSAVYSLVLGITGIVTAQFLPVGMLTPMAEGLQVSEGAAGQSVSVTALFATMSGLSVAFLTGNMNRRTVLLVLSFLMVISNVFVALAPSFTFVLIARALLGIALGGFLSMAVAIGIRLVSDTHASKAVTAIFGGVSFASVIAAPMSSYLEGIIGWKNVFWVTSAIGLIAFIWQLISLPSLSPQVTPRLRTIIDVLRRPQFIAALCAIALVFVGRFASVTYLRPFLEQTTMLNPNWVSIALLVFGLSYFAGNYFVPALISKRLYWTLGVPALLMGAISFVLLAVGSSMSVTLVLIFLWGALFAPVAPAWSTWITKSSGEYGETGGGLFVVAIQGAAAIGAAVGGLTFDAKGSFGVFTLSGTAWVVSALIVYFKIFRPQVSSSIDPRNQNIVTSTQ